MNSRNIFHSLRINSIGTTKVTSHIPGYNGFLPKADMNDRAVKQSVG